jgi:hypothetical protein
MKKKEEKLFTDFLLEMLNLMVPSLYSCIMCRSRFVTIVSVVDLFGKLLCDHVKKYVIFSMMAVDYISINKINNSDGFYPFYGNGKCVIRF